MRSWQVLHALPCLLCWHHTITLQSGSCLPAFRCRIRKHDCKHIRLILQQLGLDEPYQDWPQVGWAELGQTLSSQVLPTLVGARWFLLSRALRR
jgi:hypothetical protein